MPYSALILDLTVRDGMGGAEALQIIRELDPMAKAIVASGFADDPIMAEPVSHGFNASLSKPFSLDELSSTLKKIQ